MAASLMTRTGLPKAFSKLNRVQPLPRFLDRQRMRPLRDWRGKANRNDIVFPVVEFTIQHGMKLARSKAAARG